jgi:hypothetical protein
VLLDGDFMLILFSVKFDFHMPRLEGSPRPLPNKAP